MAEITASMPTQTQYQYTGNNNPNNPSDRHRPPSSSFPSVIRKIQDIATFWRNWNFKSEDVEQCRPEGFQWIRTIVVFILPNFSAAARSVRAVSRDALTTLFGQDCFAWVALTAHTHTLTQTCTKQGILRSYSEYSKLFNGSTAITQQHNTRVST